MRRRGGQSDSGLIFECVHISVWYEIISISLIANVYFFFVCTDTVFGILMILFAGGWSDRTGRRKPCMLLPLIGELAALIGEQSKSTFTYEQRCILHLI